MLAQSTWEQLDDATLVGMKMVVLPSSICGWLPTPKRVMKLVHEHF